MSSSDADAMLFEMGHQAMIVAWVGAACATCIVYDHALTMGKEVSRIWPARMTIARALFFVNRYIVEGMLIFTFIAASIRNLSTDFCVFYLRWLPVNISVGTITVQGILTLRVWAIYRLNKPVVWTALSLYACGSICLVTLTIIDFAVESVDVENVVNLPGCYADSVPSIITGLWIAPAIVESFFFVVVIARGFVWWKQGESPPAILTFMARDSTTYFAIIFALLSANLCMFYLASPFLSSLLVSPLNTASCILGSRMLLNLRGAAEPTTPAEMYAGRHVSSHSQAHSQEHRSSGPHPFSFDRR